jgi:hypothetical protein
MDEFAALAQRVVLTMDDVRGCLVLSRDGLVLGAFPEEQEAELKPAWLRFTHVGEARKGYVEFSDQLWAFVHRGPYAAFVVTGTSVRPGVMLDQLEQAVIAAEEARAKQKEVTLKVPDASAAPSGRPRTSLHPPADRPAPAPVATPSEEAQLQAEQPQQQPAQQQPTARQQPLSGYRRPEPAGQPPAGSAGDDTPSSGSGAELAGGARPSIEGSPYEDVLGDEQAAPFGAEASPFARLEAEQAASRAESDGERPVDAGTFSSQPQRLVSSEEPAQPQPQPQPQPQQDDEEPGEVDRVMLAKEFSGLLQPGEDGDED